MNTITIYNFSGKIVFTGIEADLQDQDFDFICKDDSGFWVNYAGSGMSIVTYATLHDALRAVERSAYKVKLKELKQFCFLRASEEMGKSPKAYTFDKFGQTCIKDGVEDVARGMLDYFEPIAGEFAWMREVIEEITAKCDELGL